MSKYSLSKIIAAGFVVLIFHPLPTLAGRIPTPTGQALSVAKTDVFDWRHWSKPRLHRPAVCREHHGNVICLNQRHVKRMR